MLEEELGVCMFEDSNFGDESVDFKSLDYD